MIVRPRQYFVVFSSRKDVVKGRTYTISLDLIPRSKAEETFSAILEQLIIKFNELHKGVDPVAQSDIIIHSMCRLN